MKLWRAIAWKVTGDRNAATKFAADLGRAFGYLFIAGGIYMVLTDSIFGTFGGVWLALVGMVIEKRSGQGWYLLSDDKAIIAEMRRQEQQP